MPLVVENVNGAQPWVGAARWHHGSFYLWGDVPALMPMVRRHAKVGGLDWSKYGQPDYKTSGAAGCFRDSAIKNNGGSWFNVAHNTTSGKGRNPDGRNSDGIKVGDRNVHRASGGHKWSPHWTEGTKVPGCGKDGWFGANPSPMRQHNSQSNKRKAASALIAKIPFELARWIGMAWMPSVAA